MANNERNIAKFYQAIQNGDGLRYGYQFLVKINFNQNVFAFRGNNTSFDSVIFKQLGITTIKDLDSLINPNPDNTVDFSFYARGTNIPQTTLTTTPVSYFATGFRFPGLMQYEKNWNVTILLDSQLNVYRRLRLWQELISSIVRNNGGNKTIPDVKGDVQLLSNDGKNVQRRFLIEGIYPTNVPQIDMKYAEGSNQIKEVQVTFATQYFH